jgi:RHS repeat-associated protein
MAVNNPAPVQRYQLGNNIESAALELDENANIISYEEYYPYGDTSYQAGRSTTEVSQKRYRYTGKEKDDESGFYYHGARYYACWLGRWTAVDPAGLVDGVNLYVYCRGNPVTFWDEDGKETQSGTESDMLGVIVTPYDEKKILHELNQVGVAQSSNPIGVEIVFDKDESMLYIRDLKHYKKDLPTFIVDFSEYRLGGVRNEEGELTHNQVLVVHNVFSGGVVVDGDIIITNDDKQKPIPNGTYDILGDRREGWFRLDKHDQIRYNDRIDDNSKDSGRQWFRLHFGRLSDGCVTYYGGGAWGVVTSILNSTSTTTVQGRPIITEEDNLIRRVVKHLVRESLTQYGTMRIIGADPVREMQRGR